MFVLMDSYTGEEYFYGSYDEAFAAMETQYHWILNEEGGGDELTYGIDHSISGYKARVLDQYWEICRDEGC